MTDLIILDTGLLVAYLNRDDKYHGWSKICKVYKTVLILPSSINRG